MRKSRYRWLLIIGLLAVLSLGVGIAIKPRPTVTQGITVSFAGYTNPPNSTWRFALFSLGNPNGFPVRWRNNWVEVEGVPYNKAPIVNRSLPWFSNPTLKAGASLTVAVGQPNDDGRWRFTMVWVRYTWRERIFDFARVHRLPVQFGRLALVQPQQIYNPANNLTNCSAWLTK